MPFIMLILSFSLYRPFVFPLGSLEQKIWWSPKLYIDAFELWCWRRLESPLDCKVIQPVHPKGDGSWVIIGGTDVEAETPILWPPDVKSWLIAKDPDAGKDWGQEKKGTTEDEMVGWHYRLNGHGFGWTLGVGDGQGGLARCSSWVCKDSDMTERLNWTEALHISVQIPKERQIWLSGSHTACFCRRIQWSDSNLPWSTITGILGCCAKATSIKPVHPKGNQLWIFTKRTDAEAEAPILWPHDVNSWLVGKDPDAGRDWKQEEKGATEDEMVGLHHWLNGHQFELTLGDT